MLLNKDIFRRYDIRGIYNKNLTDNIAELSGKAFATQVIKETNNQSPTLSVGRDVRSSSEPLFKAICKGLTESGVNVLDLGICPSPVTYFSMYSEGSDGYIMITGSHNPPEFNGIKVGTKNTVYHSEKIEQIYDCISDENFITPTKLGTIKKIDIVPKYISFITDHFSDLKDKILKLNKRIEVVIDAGSGTASSIAPEIFSNLGIDILPLYCEQDGSFPGHHPDPTVESNMLEAKQHMLNHSADFCIGYDGDADRLGALDNLGNMIWGDELIGIFAGDIANNHQGETVIADVKASQGLYEHIENIGMKSIMYFSGHSMIKEKMKQENAILGGEMSSHFFFADRYYGYDDGIYASVRLVEAYVNQLLDKKITSSSELTSSIPNYFNTPEIREYCSDDIKFDLIKRLDYQFNQYLNDKIYGIKGIINIDGLRINFENGWALVRASNTEPLLVTRYEAISEEDLNEIRKIVSSKIQELENDK
ncbi:MAG: phosphomannomutase [Denitrovibrio sp.]|nr:MAG: phosphomannomutase [Denitrovibrio sp.]